MIRLRFCSIEYTDFGCITRFPDGSDVSAWPHPDMPHYSVIAHRCGYGDDLLAYCREHEFAHALAAECLKGQRSHVLWSLAHNEEPDIGAALFEEIAAQTLQRWFRANERPIVSGYDWDGMKAYALGLLESEVAALIPPMEEAA